MQVWYRIVWSSLILANCLMTIVSGECACESVKCSTLHISRAWQLRIFEYAVLWNRKWRRNCGAGRQLGISPSHKPRCQVFLHNKSSGQVLRRILFWVVPWCQGNKHNIYLAYTRLHMITKLHWYSNLFYYFNVIMRIGLKILFFLVVMTL